MNNLRLVIGPIPALTCDGCHTLQKNLSARSSKRFGQASGARKPASSRPEPAEAAASLSRFVAHQKKDPAGEGGAKGDLGREIGRRLCEQPGIGYTPGRRPEM